jgi:hypothetical protein
LLLLVLDCWLCLLKQTRLTRIQSKPQSTQNAEIDKSERRFGRRGGAERSRDVINQTSDQLTDQFGSGNTSVNQNTQDARIRRDVFNRR